MQGRRRTTISTKSHISPHSALTHFSPQPKYRNIQSLSILEIPFTVIVLPIIIRLELSITRIGIALHAKDIIGLFIIDEDLGQIATLARGLGEQLRLTGVFERGEQERRLVDGGADGQQAVVAQDAGFVGRAERLGDEFAFGGREHRAAVRVVHRVGVVEFACVLRQHLDRLAEARPRFAVDRVCVAHGVHVRPRLVHRAVDQEACRVRAPCAVAPNDFALEVDGDHVAGLEQPEVYSQWVRPEHVVLHWVAHRDVPADALDVALARPVSERCRHVFQLPLALRFG